jgi:hypothetical protein
MPRCGICSSAKRSTIESAAEDRPLLEVARTFGVSAKSLERHLASHPRAPAPGDVPSPLATPSAGRRALSPPEDDEERGPATEHEERSPDTVRSERRGLSARERAIAIAESIDRLLKEAAAERLDGDGRRVPGASYAEKASLVRASIAANRQLAQLTGELGVSDATILASPVVQALLTKLLAVLKDHPEAAKAVLDVLEQPSGIRGAGGVAA